MSNYFLNFIGLSFEYIYMNRKIVQEVLLVNLVNFSWRKNDY